MIATVLEITGKHKAHALDAASPHDFRCRAAGRVDAERILRDPSISLYCLDERRRRAMFVQTGPHVDLARVPFCYQAQYEHAVRLFTVSYEVFHALGDQAGDRFRRLVLIVSLGRCGSTLLAELFRMSTAVLGLAEPDVYTGLAAARHANRRDDPELIDLLRTSTRLLARDAKGRLLVLKPRSTVLDLADLARAAYPAARIVFLHRDLDGWARSTIRAFGAGPCPRFVSRVLARQGGVAAYLTRGSRSRRAASSAAPPRVDPGWRLARRLEAIPAPHALALMWLGLMERSRTLAREGVPMLALSYDDLVGRREAAVREVFEYCGLPPGLAPAACAAFERDAQRDSPLARAYVQADPRRVDRHLRAMRRVLSRHPFAARAGDDCRDVLAV